MSEAAAVTDSKQNISSSSRSLTWSSIVKSLLAGGVAGGVCALSPASFPITPVMLGAGQSFLP